MKKYNKIQALRDLPTRHPKDNKNRGGKCLIIAGSQGMWGAAVLSASAAARVGAGYVYVLDKTEKFPTSKNPDFLIEKTFSDPSIFQSIAIGPGFKNQAEIKKYIQKLANIKFKNLVLDAEALNVLAKWKNHPAPLSSWILSPHEGELARLLKISSLKIKLNRMKYIKIAQRKYGCIILLKGSKTLIASQNEIWEIQSGNPSLAKAGTGDVLTGIITGLLSQKVSPLKAACLGAYIHGRAADEWMKSGHDVLSLMASDIPNLLPQTLKKIRK